MKYVKSTLAIVFTLLAASIFLTIWGSKNSYFAISCCILIFSTVAVAFTFGEMVNSGEIVDFDSLPESMRYIFFDEVSIHRAGKRTVVVAVICSFDEGEYISIKNIPPHFLDKLTYGTIFSREAEGMRLWNNPVTGNRKNELIRA